MGGLFRVLKWGMRDWYDDMVLFSGVGVLASLALIPFFLITVLALAAADFSPIVGLIIIWFLPSPALVGLSGLGRDLALVLSSDKEQEALVQGTSFGLWWQVMKRYFLRSLALFAISLAATVLLFVAMRFYLTNSNQILQLVGFVWLYGLVLWLMMQMYMLPLLLEQRQGSLLRLYRNALIVTAAKPILSLGLLIFCLLFLLLGAFTVIGLPVIVVPVITVLAAHAVQFAVYGPPQTP